jgi:hypothetical protein
MEEAVGVAARALRRHRAEAFEEDVEVASLSVAILIATIEDRAH